MAEPARPLTPEERTDYSEFHAMLLRRRDELMGRDAALRDQIEQQRAQGGAPGDEADMSVIDLNADYFLHLSDRQKDELREIRDALQRIHRGSYGTCETCGDEISPERLRRVPSARECLDCKTLSERRQAVERPNPHPKI